MKEARHTQTQRFDFRENSKEKNNLFWRQKTEECVPSTGWEKVKRGARKDDQGAQG